MTSAILRLMEELGRERPTAASLFSGIGGMDLGFEQAGFEILWSNEVNEYHAEVHRNNFPNIPMLETSIHMLSTDELIDKYGQPDVLFGGFPCTTYSRAADIQGKRWTDANPKTDYAKYAAEGGDLFLHMRRFIGDMQPKAFVIENVTELSGCRIIMETLKNTPCSITGERLGRYYTFHYGEVNTKDFGVAQNRKRMFVIGINHKVARPVFKKKELTKRHIVGEILEEEPNYTWDTERFPAMAPYVQSRIDGGYRDKASIKEIGEGVIGNTCIAHYRKDRGTTMVRRADGTITPYSPREYANFQDFPDDFILSSGLEMYAGIGNAVSVPVAFAAAEAVIELLNMLEYRMKANTKKKGEPIFFANPSFNRIENYKKECGTKFNIVFYRTEGAMETYAIPFVVLEQALTPETLSKENGTRWLTTIIKGVLTVTFDGGKKVRIDVSIYLKLELTTEVIESDCVEGMMKIPDETVDGIITSPPYKEEDGYSEELMEGWLKEAYRILKIDACMFLNFGHLAGNKERGFKVALKAVEVGFVWNDTITWVKNHYTPLNVPYRVNNLTEHIFLLTKGRPELSKLSIAVPYGMPWTVNPGEPAPENADCMKRFGRIDKCGGNVWYIKYEPKRSTDPLINGDRHKDRYPVELPLKALKLADMEGIIVDPFNGSGTTGAACISLWRESKRRIRYIGFEINPVHIENTRKWWIELRKEMWTGI